ncbi:hypothetical protein LCGC14_0470280 [marine sediment metagenome]|uniref:HNH nuclease domain-containing protein n=1 Tax=marine sediment metagenome TaxID=412755 RepID=A0A0F9SHL2_9ZZZZ
MPKKLTIEFVRDKFKEEKCLLLSNEYIDSNIKLSYVCPNSHEHSITWGDWYAGHRCSYCAGQGKPTIEFIMLLFEIENYILLTKEYINCEQKLEYICPNDHRYNISWDMWQQGYRCSYCYGNAKLTIEFIKEQFEDEGWILESTEYINSRQKLYCICSKGHRHRIRWNNWQQGCRCPVCAYIKLEGDGNPSWNSGASFEPYSIEFNNRLKKSIFERDNYICQNSDCWKTSKRLCSHHIDYDKKNCDLSNLITLCNSCNSRANFNRNFHINFYKSIMIKRGLINA